MRIRRHRHVKHNLSKHTSLPLAIHPQLPLTVVAVDGVVRMDGAFPSAKGEGFTGAPDQYGRGRGLGAGGRGFRGTAENAKTKLCNRWIQGDCRFGDRYI